MSRPVPIVPEVLLLGTLPNPGDLERSIRLQLTPGSGPAPEMAMAAAGAPGRAGRLRGPGGRLRGSGLDIGGGLVVSDPSTGLSADVRVRVRVRMLLAKPPGSGNEGVSVSLSYSDARSTQPSPHGLAAGGGMADAPSAPKFRAAAVRHAVMADERLQRAGHRGARPRGVRGRLAAPTASSNIAAATVRLLQQVIDGFPRVARPVPRIDAGSVGPGRRCRAEHPCPLGTGRACYPRPGDRAAGCRLPLRLVGPGRHTRRRARPAPQGDPERTER